MQQNLAYCVLILIWKGKNSAVRLLVCFFLIKIHSISFAISSFEQNLVSEFWRLDQSSTKIQSEISDWAVKYKTIAVISALDSERLVALGQKVYQLIDQAERLKGRAMGTRSSVLMEERFAQLYDLPKILTKQSALPLLIATLSDLVLYEQMAFWFHLSEKDSTLIKRLNEIVIYGKKRHFDRLQKAWMRIDSRKRFAENLKLIEHHRASFDLFQNDGSAYMIALRERLDSHLTEQIRKSSTFWGRLGQYFLKAHKTLRLRAKSRLNWMEYHLSKIFGTAVGAVNVQIFMKSIPRQELQRVKDEVLKPGDILVEKTDGAITDKLIPGHFSHVALYVGKFEDLQSMRLSNGNLLIDSPIFKKNSARLADGHDVVEVIRPGITLVDIRDWRISDLVVLRTSKYSREHLADALLQSLAYVGTDYDFAFDINTRSIVMCSELPYQAFKGINFRVAKSWGRWTLSPDDIAVLAGDVGSKDKNRPFQLIYFNHKTKEIPNYLRFNSYVEKLEAAGSRYYEIPSNH